MTSNVRNQGIAHLAFHDGGRPLCGNRRAHISVAIANSDGEDLCRKCEGRLAAMRDKARLDPKPKAGTIAKPSASD
jgi:hypothetical protein